MDYRHRIFICFRKVQQEAQAGIHRRIIPPNVDDRNYENSGPDAARVTQIRSLRLRLGCLIVSFAFGGVGTGDSFDPEYMIPREARTMPADFENASSCSSHNARAAKGRKAKGQESGSGAAPKNSSCNPRLRPVI